MRLLLMVFFASTIPWLTPYPGLKQAGQTKVSALTAEELAANLKTQGHAALYGILFDTNKSDIKPESEPALTQVAALLHKNPSIKLFVVGHTDNVGTAGANVDLSKRRAGAFVDELVVKYHIVPARLQPEGVGPFAPVAPNTTEEGRAKNRRVELVAQ
jgi:outer membrane protein OmpA-like peptidoglycan-associated protein